MYLHLLEKDEKPTFLAFAKHLASVDDNKIDERERYTIQYMCAEMGLDFDTETAPYDEAQLANVFLRDVARRVLVLEAVGIAHANGTVSTEQRALMTRLAAKFSLPADFLQRAESTVSRQLEVMAEFDALITG